MRNLDSPVSSVDNTDGTSNERVNVHTVVHIDTQLLNLLAGVVIPMLVAAVTRLRSSAKVKSAAMVVLSLASSFVTVALGEPEHGIPLYDLLFSWGETVIASGVFYTNVHKPLEITANIAEKTATFGLGTEVIPAGTTTQDPALSLDDEAKVGENKID